MTEHEGRCHCGAIGYSYRCETPPSDWDIRACQCHFCRAHDALSVSEPASILAFRAAEPEYLQRYRFGLQTADFLVCRRCGVYIGAIIETGKGHFGIINTHALTNPAFELAVPRPVDYGQEQTDERVLRREERWAVVTEFPE